MAVEVLLWCIAALLAIVPAAVAGVRRTTTTILVYAIALVVSTIALATVAWALVTDPGLAQSLRLPIGLPWLGAHFRLDPLAAAFLAVVNLGGATASLYGLGYRRHEPEPGRVLPFFPAFLAGMNLVVLADDAFTFLVTWEFMSLTSWALVMAHHRQPGNARAGYIYLLMASLGTLALLLTFGLLAGAAGSYAFDAIRNTQRSTMVASAVLALTLLGAGSKAGLVPLHVWLPLAHPAAPSHVSALMSGVMTKVAVYGFIRIVFDLMGPPAWWSGGVVLLFGGASAVLGVLHALMEHDLKRLLAYHTVENIGIIFIGLGLGLAFAANGMRAPAALATTAALFHVFNHSVFKSLLFFGSGAVLTATGERDMERLGGLIHRMPYTAFAFLIGSAAISALPPFNGFVSEWLTFQAILLSPQLPQWVLKFLVPAVRGLLALSAQEPDAFSLTAMFVLVVLCLAAGVLPGYFIDALAPVSQGLVSAQMPRQAVVPWLTIVPIAESRSSYNGLLLFILIAVAASLAAYVIHRWASHSIRRSAPWDCGFPDATPVTQYTAGSFAQPIRRVFGTAVFRAREEIDMPPPGDPRPARLHVRLHDRLWDALYAPIASVVGVSADVVNRVQFLTIRGYLTLVFGTLVALLVILAVWQ